MQKVNAFQAPATAAPLSHRLIVFAESSPESRSLYEWSERELKSLPMPPIEIPVWQALLARLLTQIDPCRVQTPLGQGIAVAYRQRGPIKLLALATEDEAIPIEPELAEHLRVTAQMALLTLQLKAARTQVATLKGDQERVVRAERLRAQAEAVRSFAHEFNNLLATILLRSEMAAPAAKDDQLRECFEAIYGSAEHGARLVQQLQDFTGSQPRPDQDLLDLGQLVQTVAQERWEEVNQARQSLASLRLQVRVTEDLHVMASAADVREIIGNLLDNAREAMPEGGEVTVTVGREKRQAVVRLIDHGTGLDPEVLAHCCEPFYTSKGGEHLGLGLSVVHGIVSRSGGRFTITSNDGVGATATIALPLADLRAVRRELRQKRDEAPALLRNLRVLVVDDEPGLRETLALSLESMGHKVSQAVDGRQAMGLVRYHDGFDAMVLDLVMPDVDGWEVAYLARKLQPQAAIVLLTGWGEKLAETTEDRADALLAKPVSMKELNLTICQAVRRKRDGK